MFYLWNSSAVGWFPANYVKDVAIQGITFHS